MNRYGAPAGPAADEAYGPGTFSGAVGACFNRYAVFRGRAPRSEYWHFQLFLLIVYIAATITDAASEHDYALTISELGLWLPDLAVLVRRLHDTDRSGWWCLVGVIPLIGWIFVLVWTCMPGTFGPNRFGPDPSPHRADRDRPRAAATERDGQFALFFPFRRLVATIG